MVAMIDCSDDQAPVIRVFDPERSLSEAFWFGVGSTPVGAAVLVAHEQTVLAISLAQADPALTLEQFSKKYSVTVTQRDDRRAQQCLDAIFEREGAGLDIGVSGSTFDLEVWSALRQIPKAQVRTYTELAQSMGRPGAARAVGSALARNMIGYLIPCHRVVRQDGHIGEFRWGSHTKRALLAWEQESSEHASG